MGRVDPVVTATLSDLLVNLSAGWFIAALGASFLKELTVLARVGVLTINAALGIVCLLTAIWLRRKDRK